ncbi:MAG: carboxypeptidase regulatory-like domain-containing protein [Vicinamibacterales bacterium]
MTVARATRFLLCVCLLATAPAPLLVPAAEAAAQGAGNTVRVVGVVRDEQNAIELPGVPVEVVDTNQTVYTDVDGRFVVDLAPGAHELRVVMEGYQERRLTLDVLAGQRQMTANLGLSMLAFAETVTVTAQAVDAQTSSLESQLVERKNSQVITDNLGGAEMRANADSDAAAAMTRVTGLSVVDDFVFVRGLGERYSNTTLNGAVIPTTEPDRKVVPLDLFPSGLIDSVQVAKSYVPDRSAEFAGGLVQIQPLKFPTGPTVDVSWTLGFNSITTGQDVLGYAGGGRDWLGFDDGTRNLPSGFPTRKVIRGGRFTPDVGFLRSDLERIGESFDNTQWTPRARSAKPNQSANFVAGNRFGKLGTLVSYSQSFSEQYVEELQNYYRTSSTGLTPFSEYQFQTASQRANTGLVANVAYQFSTNNRLAVDNFYTHSGKDEARTFTGFNSDIATDIRNTRLFWIEEDLLATTLTGDHFVRGLSSSSIDWRFSRAKANRDEPDLREALYERNGVGPSAPFVLSDESQSGFRMFNALDDRTLDGGANWSVFRTQWSNLPAQYKFGFSYLQRDRDFSSRRFRYQPLSMSGLDLTLDPEALFTAATIGPNWEIKEETRATDTYDAKQTVAAFYAMTDLALSASARIVAGARIEKFDQEVNTFDAFDFDGRPDIVQAKLENTDVFPAVNFVLSTGTTQNLRMGFSQTVNRPEFRELAPFEFTDIVGGRAVVGNPDLTRALIQNVDLRWEMFPSAEEVLAVSFFYKHFSDPIERIVEPTAQLRTSFTNADSASNIGLEFEGRKRVAPMLLVGGNYTFVDSNITLAAAAAQVQTSLERPLAGQSKHLVNAVVEVGGGPATVRLLYNFFGTRISDVGSLGLPDILQDGRGALDMVFSTRLRSLNIRFSADNLTNEAFDFNQGGLLQRSYKTGRTFALNFGFSAF